MKRPIRIGDKTYTFDLSLDLDALAAGRAVRFALKASVAHKGGYEDEVELTVEVSRDEASGELVLAVIPRAGPWEEPFILPLSELVNADTALGQAIEALPLGRIDPGLGCAVRAGLSAIIDQIILCRRNVTVAGFGDLAWAMLGCLARNTLNIGRKALLRFVRCAFSLGG